MKRRTFQQYLLSLTALALTGPTLASTDYPSKPISVVVPYSPGGSTDNVTRLIAQGLATRLKQPVVVENRVGGGGTIGWNSVARSGADGYTLLTTETSFSIAAGLLPNLPYDHKKGFSMVTIAASVPHVVVVNASLPVTTFEEFLALAKKNPEKVFYGSGGVGTNTHLGGELLKNLTGVNMTHVPYKGASAVLGDLMSGQVQMMVSSIPTVLPSIKAGMVRPLLVTDTKRSDALPDVPSATDVGLPGLAMQFWIGFAAPAGTSDQTLDLLNKEIVEVVKTPEIEEKLQQQGLEVVANSRADAQKMVNDEMNRWEALIKKANITAKDSQ
jgi:tripartite-type tricarboxylate transporter receptor subunit TctC